MKGFTFYLRGKDIFVETNYKNKTEALASKIFRKLINYGYNIPDNPSTRKNLLWTIQRAECEIKTLSNGKKMYEIHGANFGGKGSFVDDGNTLIIKL